MRYIKYLSLSAFAVALASAQITATFQPGSAGYDGVTERFVGLGTSGAVGTDNHFVKDSAVLLRFDLSTIPTGSAVERAELVFYSGNVYAPTPIEVNRVYDPDHLGDAYPDGWSNLTAGASLTYRDQTKRVPWALGDSATGDNLSKHVAPSESIVIWAANRTAYTHNVTQAVNAWVSGQEPNQGWLICTRDAKANTWAPSSKSSAIDQRVKLIVTFTPPPGGGTPSAITDLQLDDCPAKTCNLMWTAPGDDGANGTALFYDIRYSFAPITAENWSTAIPLPMKAPAPLESGSSQTITVPVADALKYYFAIRTYSRNWSLSDLSNVASVDVPNTRGVIAGHPRLLIDSARLQNMINRVTPGNPMYNAAAATDLKNLQKIADGSFTVGTALQAYGDNAGMLMPLMYALLYRMGIPRGNTGSANSYADKAIDEFLLLSNDWVSKGDGAAGGTDTYALQGEALAIVYDWCYPRLVERNLLAAAQQKLKTTYAVLADDAKLWQVSIRESDFHNYSVAFETAYLALGLALYGEDPAAPDMVNRGWGMIAEGYMMQPAATSTDKVLFRLKSSIDILTGGAMNWEGPRYWRSAVPEILRGIEEYDVATGRTQDVWKTLFPNTIQSGYYKIYMLRPDGKHPGLGDGNAGDVTSGRDNFGMVILLDRFQDPYIRTFVDTSVTNGAWNAGQGGDLGFVWKLIFYPYENQVTARPFADLPLARRFGKDIVVRSGWGPNDTYFTFSVPFGGVYHNHLDANSFTLFRKGDLALQGGPYSTAFGEYFHGYFRRTVASNSILAYDSSECWRDNGPACALINDGGQRWPFRRYKPQQNSPYAIDRLWSGSLFDPSLDDRNPLGPLYRELHRFVDDATMRFQPDDRYVYIRSDATGAYTNQYSGTGDNQNRRISSAVREVAFLQPQYIVMLDRVSTTSKDFPKSWLLHSVNAPQVQIGGQWQTPNAGITDYSTGAIRMDQAGGRLYLQPVKPDGVKATVIGGNNCSAIRITSSISNGTSTTFFTAAPHGFTDGEMVNITGAAGWWAGGSGINGVRVVRAPADNSFRLENTNGYTVNGSGTTDPLGPALIDYHQGCGWEGWVDGKNRWYPDSNPSMGRWRVELKPPTAQQDDVFLNVLFATESTNQQMPTVQAIENDGVLGVTITDSGTPKVVIFPKVGEGVQAVQYAASYSGTAQHLVTGLLPGTYKVQLGNETLANYGAVVVNANSTLYFEAPAGAFSIIALPSAQVTTVRVNSKSAASAVLQWTAPQNKASCAVELSTDAGFSTAAGNLSVAQQGRLWNTAAWNLSPGTRYYYRVSGCASATGNFLTAAQSGSGNIAMRLSGGGPASVEYCALREPSCSPSNLLHSTGLVPCDGGCRMTIPAASGDALVLRWKYGAATSAVEYVAAR